MVQPAPQPFSVAATASVSGWSGSGVNPAASSSPTGSFPGPHYVEEQSLNIKYVRVPQGRVYNAESNLTLTAASSIPTVVSTRLACIVTASYSRKRVDAIFDTSTYQQPQKFQFLGVSSDAQGNSYGSIDASTLGPAGEIVTVQPWYYRRPFDATSDIEIASSVTVANYGIGASAFNMDPAVLESRDQTEYSEFETFFVNPDQRFTFLRNGEPYAYGTPVPSYRLHGPYNTNQESLVQIINFIDEMSNNLSVESLYTIPAEVIDNTLRRTGGLPFYSASRHDYS